MKKISYDRKSLLIDGKRVFIISGEVHYFRIPRALWRDRLIKSKEAGLNTISTYIPWNYHECKENKFDFKGEKDLEDFFDLCQQLGFYIIARPGPYICAEWDLGGIPAWLLNKENIKLRTDNAAYLKYVARWFDKIIPIIDRNQITKNGNVILVQIENEYGSFLLQTKKRERNILKNSRGYLAYLKEALVKSGIGVPFFTCDGYEPQYKYPGSLDGVMECANFGENPELPLRRLRNRQRSAPLMVTELWIGPRFDVWGGKHHSGDGRGVEDLVYEILKYGVTGINYYMWAGGTNFGYWGGRTSGVEDGEFVTQSYDCNSPISEVGELTSKYYYLKRANLFINKFAHLFTSADTSPNLTKEVIRNQREKVKEEPVCECAQKGNFGIIKPSNWKYCKEQEFNTDWKEIPDVAELSALGCYQGYGWYRNRMDFSKNSEVTLIFPAFADRLTVFLNGKFITTIGYQSEEEDRLGLNLKKGENLLDIMADNLGRYNYGPNMGEPKGIYATPILEIDGKKSLLKDGWKFRKGLLPEEMNGKCWQKLATPETFRTPTWFKAEFAYGGSNNEIVRLRMDGLSKGQIYLNGYNIGRYWNIGPQEEYWLPESYLKKENTLIIFEEEGKAPKGITLFSRPLTKGVFRDCTSGHTRGRTSRSIDV